MLLGVSGLVNGDWRAIDSGVLRRVRGLGFSVLQVRIDDPASLGPVEAAGLREMFLEHGVVMGQTVGNYGGGLVSPDDAERSAAIEFVKRTCSATAALGAPNTYLRPGSLNSNGAWLPHAGNRSEEVFDRLVDSTRQICAAAESEGVMVAVEGGAVSPLYSARRVLRFIESVGSPSLGFNVDPVNFIDSIGQAYDNAALQREFYDLLSGRILGAHAKDFRIVDALLLHLEEEVIGRGILDQGVFLSGMQASCPRGHVLIEHLPDDLIPAALEGLLMAANRCGIVFDCA